MCSITGFLATRRQQMSKGTLEALAALLEASEIRGRDGFGCAFFGAAGSGRRPVVEKEVRPWKLGKLRGQLWYLEMLRQHVHGSVCMIANHRAEPTTEYVEDKSDDDQQPYSYGDWWAVHNGTIANDKEMIARHKVTPPTSIDSYAVPVAVHHEGTLNGLKGSMAVLLWNDRTKRLVIHRNYKPLTVLWLPAEGLYVFSSLPLAEDLFSGCEVIGFPPYSTATEFPASGDMDGATVAPKNRRKALVVCSGGLDSVTVAKIARMENDEVTLLHFKYGCHAEKKEVEAVMRVAADLACAFEFVDMGWLKRLGGSALTEDGAVIADGAAGAEFAHEWVPARNTAMIGIAASYADRYDCGRIYLGLNLEEAGAYPDNTVEFFEKFNAVLDVGTQARPEIVNPLAYLMKREIVEQAYKIAAPIHLAWSCYRGGAVHCGECGPCHMRRTAHRMLGLKDTVTYAK